MSVILLNHRVVHYEVLGRGRPLIFLHGWFGSWRYWVPLMQAAATNYRAYAVDLWGFGDTSKGAPLYAPEAQVDLLKGFLEEMGIGQVALVGHGLGAIVGLQFAYQNPGLVNRVLAVSYPIQREMIHSRLTADTPERVLDWVLEKSPLAEPLRADAVKNDPDAIRGFLTGIESIHLAALCKQSELMCLLVHGLEDPLVAAPGGEVWKEMPYNTHGIVFEQSGHFPMIDEDNKFNRLLVEFLSLASGETPRDLQLKEEWKRRVR